MRRGTGRENNTTEVLLDPSHIMLKNSVKFGSERNLNDSSLSDFVFENGGKQQKRKKKREHRLTVPGIYLSPVQSASTSSLASRSGDSGTDGKKAPTLTLDDGVNKVALTTDDNNNNNNGGLSRIARSPSFRRKKAAIEQPPEFNIVLLGALGVGKTGLVSGFFYISEFIYKSSYIRASIIS